jgi:hypothetical protein
MLYDEQLTRLWVGICVAISMGLFPPWQEDGRFAGWRWLWHKSDGRVDVVRLVIQWAVVAAVTFGAVLAAGPHRSVFQPTW